MTTEELQNFIDNYKITDHKRIKLEWNGYVGGDFKDENYSFRMQVCELVILQIEKVNLELIRDLYSETGKTSPLTFSIYLNFHILANELLKRGGTTYLLDYIRGASHSMDAFMRSGWLTLSKQTAKELLAYFDELKATSNDPEVVALLNTAMRDRLEYHVNI